MRQQQTLDFPKAAHPTFQQQLSSLTSPYRELEKFLVDIYPIIAAMPDHLRKAVLDFRNKPWSPGFLHLTNFPLDEVIPPTPTDESLPEEKTTFVSEAWALGIAQILGDPLGYLDEKKGAIIQNISPVKLEHWQTTSVNSEIDLGFHVDLDYARDLPHMPFNHQNPDVLVLVCLRQDPDKKACTMYADARDIMRHLSPKDIEILREPRFQFGASYTFTGKAGSQKVWSTHCAILQGPETFPEIGMDMFCGVRGIDDEASDTLAKVGEICRHKDVMQTVYLRSGDILLINNRKGSHARTAFPCYYDGTDRWVQRVYTRRCLWEMRGRLRQGSRVF